MGNRSADWRIVLHAHTGISTLIPATEIIQKTGDTCCVKHSSLSQRDYGILAPGCTAESNLVRRRRTTWGTLVKK